jgi:hypothetical protein
LSFDRVGRINLYFKKIQNGVVLIKKKKQKLTGCNRVFDRVGRVMTFPIFLSTRPSFSLGSAESRIDLLDQTNFKTMVLGGFKKKKEEEEEERNAIVNVIMIEARVLKREF